MNRFLTRDLYAGALKDFALGTGPWNTNRYMFGGGNPVSRIELDGHRNEMDYHGRTDRSGGTAVTQRLGSRDVTSEDDSDFSAAYEVVASKRIGKGGGQGRPEIVYCNDTETWKVENGREQTCGQSDVAFSKLFAEDMCRQPGIVCGPYNPTGPQTVGLGHDSGAVRLTGGPEAPTGRRAMGGGGPNDIVYVFRAPNRGNKDMELSGGLNPANHTSGDRMAYLGTEDVARIWANRKVGTHENGYIRFAFRREDLAKFGKSFPYEGGPGREWMIPLSRIEEFNSLTINREWVDAG